MKYRISKKLLNQLQPALAEAITAAQAQHPSIKSLTHQIKPAGFVYITGEGERITAVNDRGDQMSIQMVAEHTVGASGVRYEIGARISLPAGAALIVIGYMSGYYMTVYTIGDVALEAAGFANAAHIIEGACYEVFV